MRSASAHAVGQACAQSVLMCGRGTRRSVRIPPMVHVCDDAGSKLAGSWQETGSKLTGARDPPEPVVVAPIAAASA